MLEVHDLKQIGTIVREEIASAEGRIVQKTTEAVVTQVGEMMEQNLIPALERIIDDKIEKKLEEKLESKFNAKLAPLPDKDFVSRQTAILQGSAIARQRKQQDQITLIAEVLHEKKIFTDAHIVQLKEMNPVPSLDDLRAPA